MHTGFESEAAAPFAGYLALAVPSRMVLVALVATDAKVIALLDPVSLDFPLILGVKFRANIDLHGVVT